MNTISKLLLGMSCGLLASPLAAQSQLFSVRQDLGKAAAMHAHSWEVERSAEAFNAESPSVLLPSPGKQSMLALRTGGSTREDGFVWHGRIGDKPVLISVRGEQLFASFASGLEHYTVSSQRGKSVLAKVDLGANLEDDPTPMPRSAVAATAPVKNLSTNNDVQVIRVLVPYTEAAMAAAGGGEQIIAAAQFMIDQTNAIVASSVLADIHFELAGSMPIAYADGMSTDTALTTLKDDSAVAQMRDAVGADVVIGILENSDLAGRAYMPGMLHVGNEGFAFGVVVRNYALNFYTFTHELGHIFGLDHGGTTAPGGGAFPWARGFIGYVDENAGYPEGFVTIMAQLGFCGGSPPCYTVPYFSNPELTLPEAPVRGRAMGVADEADNARAFREAAVVVSQYRAEVVSPALFVASFEEG